MLHEIWQSLVTKIKNCIDITGDKNSLLQETELGWSDVLLYILIWQENVSIYCFTECPGPSPLETKDAQSTNKIVINWLHY